MGKRKHLMAERLKEAKKQTAIAVLKDAPTSPRKMRLVADTIRGIEVNHALDLLHFSKKEASVRLETLLKSAIANWEAKNPEQTKELEEGNVIVKTISATVSVSPVVGTPTGSAATTPRRSPRIMRSASTWEAASRRPASPASSSSAL